MVLSISSENNKQQLWIQFCVWISERADAVTRKFDLELEGNCFKKIYRVWVSLGLPESWGGKRVAKMYLAWLGGWWWHTNHRPLFHIQTNLNLNWRKIPWMQLKGSFSGKKSRLWLQIDIFNILLWSRDILILSRR